MAALQYADIFSNILIELYGQSQVSVDLYNSNSDIQIVNGKNLKIPKLSVSGYKDHTRGSLGFNTGSYSNEYETKTLDHDRDIEFVIDPVDVDETNLVVTIANIQKRFETTQAIPEADCYTFSKLYSEAKRVGAKIKTTALTTANVLSDFDDNLEAMIDAGVPLDRVILYCTPAYLKLLKNAEGIQRTLEVSGAKGIDRRVHSIDDIGMIKEVPSARFKSKYNFTSGCTADVSAVQMDYMLIDPECQVSRNKYSFITVFEPGTDSRTADNYLYQNRKLDELMKEGCIIHAAAE